MKSCFVPLCPTQDVDHPFVQHIHTVYGTHTSSIEKKKKTTHSIYRIGFSTIIVSGIHNGSQNLSLIDYEELLHLNGVRTMAKQERWLHYYHQNFRNRVKDPFPDPNFPRLDLKDLAKPVQEIQYEYCGGRTHCRRTSSWRSQTGRIKSQKEPGLRNWAFLYYPYSWGPRPTSVLNVGKASSF